jgi:hypothetical protein
VEGDAFPCCAARVETEFPPLTHEPPPSRTSLSSPYGRPRPHALAVLYLQLLPLQCRQCGLRQPDSRTGKRKMDEHLDWHFVHKRRMREAAGRASGRSWFTSEEVRSRQLFRDVVFSSCAFVRALAED